MQISHLPLTFWAQINSVTSRSINLIASNYCLLFSHPFSYNFNIRYIIYFRLIKVEQKRKPFTSEQRSNDVGPEIFAPTLTEIFTMSEATTRWKGLCNLAYDFYDARVRSFFNWPRYLSLTPHIVNHRRFLYSGKRQPFLLILLQC